MSVDSDLRVTSNPSQKKFFSKKIIYKPIKYFMNIKVRTGLRRHYPFFTINV